jgi:hypothetical protein
MGKLSLETRKTRLMWHIYYRILDELDHTWTGELDALQDILYKNEGGMTEWTVTKDNCLTFR